MGDWTSNPWPCGPEPVCLTVHLLARLGSSGLWLYWLGVGEHPHTFLEGSLLIGIFNGTKAVLAQGSFQSTVFCGFHSQHLLGPRPLFLQGERGIQLRIKKSVFGSGFQHGTCESAQRKQESVRNDHQKVFGFFFFFFPFRSFPLNIKTQDCIFQSL